VLTFRKMKAAPRRELPTLTDHQAYVLMVSHEACKCSGLLTRAAHMAAIYQRARQRLADLDAR
jgi:hypothetical protein